MSPPKGVEVAIKVCIALAHSRPDLTVAVCTVQALPRIAASVPNALLVVAGQAHPVLGRGYVKQLKDLAASLGVGDAVKFQSSFLAEPDLLHLYQVRVAIARFTTLS